MRILLMLGVSFLCFFASCTKKEIVEVEKIVEVEVEKENISADAIDKIETYLANSESKYGLGTGAPNVVLKDLKQLAKNINFDYVTIYGGNHCFDLNDLPIYGSDGHIIVLLWSKFMITQVRVYGYTGYDFRNTDYRSLAGENLKPVSDFSNNTYIGTITKSDIDKK